MQIKTPAVWAALLLLGFTACNNAPKESAAPADAPDVGAVAVPSAGATGGKPETFLYAVNVNNLLLRDQPSQKSSQVVTKFKEGDLVTGRGEVSSQTEEAEIRGMTMKEPFYKVMSLGTPQHTGWAYGGALTQLYAGPASGSPDPAKLRQLTNYLKSLNVKKLESGKKAWDYVQTSFATAEGSLADAALVLLEKFLNRMEMEGEFYKITEKIEWLEGDYAEIHEGRFDASRYPAAKNVIDNGFRLTTAEGMVFPQVDLARLESFFGPKITEPFRTYLRQKVEEQKNVAMSDGGLVVPIQEIADRAAFWEKFNQAYPFFPAGDETRESQQWYRFTLTNGADNTPVFDYETQIVQPDFREVWDYVIQKHPGTQLAETILAMRDLVAAEGWKRTKKVEDFQAKQAAIYSEM